jgi:hypothetical protein
VEKERSSGVERSGVRHWRLLQIGGHAGENKRGKLAGGGCSARACHTEERKQERESEGAPGVVVNSTG